MEINVNRIKIVTVFTLLLFAVTTFGQEKKSKIENISPCDSVFLVVETMPSFPGGQAELMKFISQHIKYPEKEPSIEQKIRSRFVIDFIVEKDGSLSNIKLKYETDPAWEAALMEMMNKMPKWTPGVNEGDTVRVRYLIPLHVDWR